jgi:hypothetical protein
LEYFLSEARTWNYRQKRNQCWELPAVVWNDGLSACLAASILLALRAEVADRAAKDIGFEDGEMVVAVCCAIRRVVGPFQLVVDKLLSDADDGHPP